MEEKDSRIGAVYVVEERSYTLWRGGSHNRKGLWRVNSGRRWGILEEVDGSSIQVFKYYLWEEDLKSQLLRLQTWQVGQTTCEFEVAYGGKGG